MVFKRFVEILKIELGGQVGTKFGAKLAYQSANFGSEGQVDVNLEAKRHQVGAQRGFGGAQGGAKRAQKGYELH